LRTATSVIQDGVDASFAENLHLVANQFHGFLPEFLCEVVILFLYVVSNWLYLPSLSIHFFQPTLYCLLSALYNSRKHKKGHIRPLVKWGHFFMAAHDSPANTSLVNYS